jgi:hypothetical protein
MGKWIEKLYRPVGFMLLGALAGSGLTLAVLGKLSIPVIVPWMVGLLALGFLVAKGRRDKVLIFLVCGLLSAGNAASFWMRGGKLPDAILFTVLALIYVGSAWSEHGKQRKKHAGEVIG